VETLAFLFARMYDVMTWHRGGGGRMRWQFKVMLVFVFGFFALEVALGQIPMQLGQLGGLMGKDAKTDPLTLLHNASVKKELRLSEDQAVKVDAAVWDALAKVLDSDQLKRLKQIDLQQRDYLAFGDTSLQATLKLTKDQKDSIKTILADADKELTSLMENLKGAFGVGGIAGGAKGGFQGTFNRLISIRKETRERCTEVLTNEQKRMWEELVGDEFRMELPKIDFGDFNKPKKK
jgi:hypothetical protein